MVWDRNDEIFDTTLRARRVSLAKAGQSQESIDFLFEQEKKAELEKQSRLARKEELTEELQELKELRDSTKEQLGITETSHEQIKEMHKELVESFELSRKGLEQQNETYRVWLQETAEQSTIAQINEWLKSFDELKPFVQKLFRDSYKERFGIEDKTIICFLTYKDKKLNFRIEETEPFNLTKLTKVELTKKEE